MAPGLVLAPAAPAPRPGEWRMLTAIEPSDASEPLASAMARQERMLASGTFESAGLAAGAAATAFARALGGSAVTGAAFAGLVGASIAAGELFTGVVGGVPPAGLTLADAGTSGSAVAIGVLGAAGAEYRYQLALPALYPLAAPTLTAATVNEAWPHRLLASVAWQPLLEPTPPAGLPGPTLAPAARALPAPFRVARPIVVSEAVGSRAYRTFTQLAGWLGMTQHETARLLGIGRTTPLAWRRGHEPRPSRARRLYQTHALVNTLVRRLGQEETRLWLVRGNPSPLALIAAGDVTRADDRAEELIFGAHDTAIALDAWREDEPTQAAPAGPTVPAPRVISRPAPRRRAR